ncbi:MAG TPA: hypothetical protein VFT87_01160, partial [Candidatus Saccharimonadales bacterium]|nr:hypothetical protein [Candidatus Saccharimonadales bacterium]
MLQELSLKEGDLIIDVGSGDGVVLKAAAQHGLRAIGYEINPILCLVAYVRCWRVRSKVTIYWRDFWTTPLPKDTKLVYVFLAGPFMQKFATTLARQAGRRQVWVASNGFAVPGWRHAKNVGGIYVYSLPSALQRGE